MSTEVAPVVTQPGIVPNSVPTSTSSGPSIPQTFPIVSNSSPAPATTLTSSVPIPFSTQPVAEAVSSTTSPASATISTPITSSSTTSTPTSTSSTTSITEVSSAAASPGLNPSTKIGIGLGVPLGVIVLAIFGFLILRYRRHRKVSRRRHHDDVATAGLSPAGEKDKKNMANVENSSEPQGPEKKQVHEIQGTEVPAYLRELAGSPGVRRHELPSRRGSA